jgi:hypothetical protein
MLVRPVAIRGPLPLVVFLFAIAACGGDGERGPPPSGTVAYIVTACQQTGAQMTLQQEVRILRGETEAVTAMSVGPLGPFPSLACAFRGSQRLWFYPQYGPLQRFGITPDGSGVVFELTDEFVREGHGLLPPDQRGIYYMPADGSDLRRLGPASRSPGAFYSPGGISWVDFVFEFHPSGRAFTYTDRGPDEAGHEAAQVFVQGLTPGEPSRQVTRLPALNLTGQWPEMRSPSFIDPQTILFERFTEPATEGPLLTVGVDGTDLREVPRVALPGGQVIPVFSIIGADWIALRADMAGEPVKPHGDLHISEAFVTDGTNVVQLTKFGRVDTCLGSSPFYSGRDRRVYFTVSADPFGTNPSQNCQIFSIEPVSRDLRQLTFFRESAAAPNGCIGDRRPNGCRIDFSGPCHPSQNPHTGTIFFWSSCDPFGQNRNGYQLFAMHPDGSGLRQLTNAVGAVRGADHTYEVETVDAFWSAPY